MRYLGIEIDDAIEIAVKVDILWQRQGPATCQSKSATHPNAAVAISSASPDDPTSAYVSHRSACARRAEVWVVVMNASPLTAVKVRGVSRLDHL